MTDFSDFDALRAAVGTEIGTGDWFEIDRSRIDGFAEATDDRHLVRYLS
ncbi:hypothetical protein OG225_18840 [Nocardia sp. NBC_01377]